MPKPKYTPEKGHTQKKLRIFSAYLDRYLTILLPQKYVGRVDVYDMFAGQGMYQGDAGSAMLALETIKKHRARQGKNVRLHLNENNPEHFQKLCEHIGAGTSDSSNWASCSQQDANDAIAEKLGNVPQNSHKLFYLDPFGYSQIKKPTLDAIVRKPGAECLLFVPVSNIVRFIRKGAEAKEQLPTIAKFIEEYGINIRQHSNAEWQDWGGIIRTAFIKTYGQAFRSPYIGIATLKTARANYYALYFFSKHPKGMEQFTEIVNRVKEDEEPQLNLFVPDNREVLQYLSDSEKGRTNNDIYDWLLRQSWAIKNARACLYEMEKSGKITVQAKTGKRKSGDFYLSYKRSRESPKIVVKLNRDGN